MARQAGGDLPEGAAMTDIAIRVLGGLPAIARVTHYLPYIPATWDDPPDGPELDWELLDARGRKADWIARRLTTTARAEIETDLLKQCETDYRNRHYADF